MQPILIAPTTINKKIESLVEIVWDKTPIMINTIDVRRTRERLSTLHIKDLFGVWRLNKLEGNGGLVGEDKESGGMDILRCCGISIESDLFIVKALSFDFK